MRIEPVDRGGVAVVAVLAILAVVPATMGCIGDEEPEDVTGWWLAMGFGKFDTNGERPVNVSKLVFSARFGEVQHDEWYLQETDGFYLAEERTIPFRIEARYVEASGSPEDFPIVGSSHVLTGELRVRGTELTLDLDGDPSLFSIEPSSKAMQDTYRTSADLTGDYGDLELFFTLTRPME